MIELVKACDNDIPNIRSVAYKTWPQAFGEILTPEQISYMLDMMYSEHSLREQMNSGHQFIMAFRDEMCCGYASYEQYESIATKVHKIYILPECQGMGIGSLLINHIGNIARDSGNVVLTLNVNRYNPAVKFYQKIGFSITKEEDIDIGKGFLMEDFVMEKPL